MQEKCKLFKFVLLFEAFIGYASIASVEVFCKKNVHSEADRAILAKNSVRIYTILCSKAWLYSERMKKKIAKKEMFLAHFCVILLSCYTYYWEWD